ncbi:MAG: hypothetical protein KDI90_08790 [Alphaproteobacteria bacterium]|nr:hypothetical protein [Alphaproteobacteria bacterium]MCB9975857.1 hypothetical protein [Rhodospirillales bacterium]
MKRYLLASAVMIAFVPFKAQAAQIDAEGAAHLKEVFKNLLQDQKEINEVFGSIEVIYTGEVSVEPKGEYYAVVLPKISFGPGAKLKEAMGGPDAQGTAPEAPAFSMDLGQAAINAVPDDKQGYWKMTVALPSSMSFGVANEMAMNINIGEQNTSGLFHEASGNFLKMNSLLKDVKFSMTANGSTHDFAIPEFKVNTNLEEDGQGHVSGPTTIRASGMQFDIPDEHAKVSLGALQLNANISKYRLIPMSEYKAKIMTFGEKLASFEKAAETGQPPSATEIEEMINAALALNDYEGINFAYSLENLEFAANPPQDDFKQGEDIKNLKIASGIFGMGLEGLKSETASLNVNFSYSGVSVEPTPQGYEGIIPDSAKFDVTAGKIPLQSIWTAGMNAGKAALANPDTGPMAAMGLMMQVPMMLTQAGTEISVKDNFVNAKDYKATLNGNVKADVSAIMQFVADFKGRFEGLDGLLAKAQANANNPDMPNAYEFQDIASQLSMLKEYGAASGNGYDFDIKVTPDGKATVNGKEIPLMGGGAGGPPMQNQDPAAGGDDSQLPY